MTGADIGLGWVDQSGQMHFEVDMQLFTLSFYQECRCVYRIGMLPLMHNQWSIIRPLTGLVFVVEKKMDGQLSSFIVLSLHVIQWMFPSKYAFNIDWWNDHTRTNIIYLVGHWHSNLCLWSWRSRYVWTRRHHPISWTYSTRHTYHSTSILWQSTTRNEVCWSRLLWLPTEQR